MFGVGHERLARSRVVVAGAVTGILVLVLNALVYWMAFGVMRPSSRSRLPLA